MPRTKTTHPAPSREKGQRSIDLPDYLLRWLPEWKQPKWYNADVWRYIVRAQPIATDCRETLTSNLLALEWKIEPRDSTKRDEYKEDIEYYTDFFEYTGKYDYTEIIEWIAGDYLDIPFGAGVELGWANDTPPDENPNSKLLWILLLDGGTLYPTLNDQYPVGQAVQENIGSVVYFPKYAINRMYMSPRQEIRREGWGMAPPEKIYLAIELLNRGDQYYANLLLDTPEAGILDLGDMAEESAKKWLDGWKTLMDGIDPFKVPVLYEHEKAATYIPFSRSPVDMTFNQAVTRYGAIVCAGYGMSLSDIGVSATSSSGETLAGSIRQERKTKRTGFARMKKKTIFFFNRMLPPHLRFHFIDLDDEVSVALGRARLANATAWQQMVQAGMFTPAEGRQQTIADGLTSISIPEEPPEEAKQVVENKQKLAERPTMLGRPVAPSAGGQGEVMSKADLVDYFMENVPEFREIMEELDEKFDDFDLDKKSKIWDALDECLTIPELT